MVGDQTFVAEQVARRSAGRRPAGAERDILAVADRRVVVQFEIVAAWRAFEPFRVPCHNSSMTAKRLKRPRDPVQLGKLMGDILTGQVEDRAPTPQEEGKDIAAVNRGKARAKSHGSLARRVDDKDPCLCRCRRAADRLEVDRRSSP